MRSNLTLAITLCLATLTIGCGADNPAGPSGMSGGTSQYDGLWIATTPGYPEEKLQIEIQGGEIAHVYYAGFYDLLRCIGEPDVRLDPAPRPPVSGGQVAFTIAGSPVSISGQLAFISSTEASGKADVDYDEGGFCVYDGTPFSFTATRL